MSRVANLRTLNRFTVHRLINANWQTTEYRVKPRGFSTVLFTITRPEGTSLIDFDHFMRAVEHLCDTPAPERRTTP